MRTTVRLACPSPSVAMLFALACAAVWFAAVPSIADAARPTIKWIAPQPGQTVNEIADGCRIRVRGTNVRKVTFLLDRRRLGSTSRAPYRCSRRGLAAASRSTRDQRLRLTAIVLDRMGRKLRSSIWLRIRRPTPPRRRDRGTTSPRTPPAPGTPAPPRTTPPPVTPVPPTQPPAPQPPTAPARPADPEPAPAPVEPSPIPDMPTPVAPEPEPPAEPPAPTVPSPPADPAQQVVWSADYSTSNFRQWSWYGQGQAHLWGHISVIDPRADGVPAPPIGSPQHVARMTVTPEDAAAKRYHAKLFQWWNPNGRSPADVSGTYSSWYYLPADYSVPYEKWTNLFQFKEEYPGGQDPLWWIQASAGSWADRMTRSDGADWLSARTTRADQPVAHLSYWRNPFRRRLKFMALPLGRWFEIRAELRQGDRIDFYIDGVRFDTARASEYPVNPFRSGSAKWIFGAGNYSTAPGTTLYLGRASYAR